MTDKDIEEQCKIIREVRNKVCSSKKLAREFLIKTGLYNKNGTLKKDLLNER